MLKRTLVAVAAAAAVLSATAGPAHASCADDAQTNLTEGYSPSPKSYGYWPLYVKQTGPATVTFYGDTLVADYSTFLTGDVPNFTNAVVGNAPGTTTEFVDCVAG